MPGPCERALGELLAQARPASVLCIATRAPEPLTAHGHAPWAPASAGATGGGAGPVTLLDPQAAHAALPQLPRFDFAVVWDALAPLPRQLGEQLLAGLRDRLAGRVAVRVAPADDWAESDLLALGFMRLARCGEGEIYGFDIADYKTTPDWLNPRFWAHPERWDKAWW